MTADLFGFPDPPEPAAPRRVRGPKTPKPVPPILEKPAAVSAPPAPPEPEIRIYSVTEVTRSVRDALESQIGVVWVEGEISNHRKQSSGHQYFTLKDAQCQLSCVLFARGAWRKQIPLSDGMHVQVRGILTVYEARGQYQMNVQLVQVAGAGLLQAKFEALKRKLDEEGLFDPARKRPLPKFPVSIALVTSPTGAALRDMLNILTRRAPSLRVLISPVRVQGEGAGLELAAAVTELNGAPGNGLPCVDVIVVTRGGGSIEDLWAFNDETLARAIAVSRIPVVSAVGHEIDFTIADFVADLRAPTPSAAAELVAPEKAELLRRLEQVGNQIRRCVLMRLEREKAQLAYLSRGVLFGEPRRRLNEASQQLDFAADALARAVRMRLEKSRRGVAELLAVVRQHRPDQLLAIRRHQLESLQQRLAGALQRRLEEKRQRLQRGTDMLRLLAPQTVLERGFSITTLRDGRVLQSVREIEPGMELITRLGDGSVRSEVQDVWGSYARTL
ncbi:MAG: exodeoxyribonuclease VII large subunit, partial [Verrucomicrobiota bacterium]